MINIDRYHHIGRTYVNISRASRFFRFRVLGLTPQAKMGVAASRLLIVACQCPGYLVPVAAI